jgi:hypothetical protein
MKIGNFCKIAVISACWSFVLSYFLQTDSNCGFKAPSYELSRMVAVWWMIIPLIAIAVGLKVGKAENPFLDCFFEFSLGILGVCFVLNQAFLGWLVIHPCETNTHNWILGALIDFAISVPFGAIALGAWWFLQNRKFKK